MALPTDAKVRKGIPIFSGLIRYFPHACAAVAQLSRICNEQHNPGQPLHWAKEKSTDEMDALLRHVTDQAIEPEHRDPDGCMAAVKKAWRALADLERMHDAGINIFAVEPDPTPKTNMEYLEEARREFAAKCLDTGGAPSESITYRLRD